jgi:hypothetical protein
MVDTTKKLYTQFNIQAIVRYPCDANFEALLNQVAVQKRSYDSQEAVKNVNEWGEVIMTYPTAPIINSSLKVRIDPEKNRTADGFKVEFQGGLVTSDYKAFVCAGSDVRENDELYIGTRHYKVLLVEELFERSKLHHLELRLCRLDLL